MSIAELQCVNPDGPASLDELGALSAARTCIDEMLRSCVDELRTHPDVTYSWSTLAYALGSSSVDDVRRRYGSPLKEADERAVSFWTIFAPRFVWDFLPVDFTYALYVQWMASEFPDDTPLLKKVLTRRLKLAVASSEDWIHTRSRPGSLMSAEEPLVAQLPGWTRDGSIAAIYGFRRRKAGVLDPAQAESAA